MRCHAGRAARPGAAHDRIRPCRCWWRCAANASAAGSKSRWPVICMFVAPDAALGQPEMKLGVFAPAASCLLPELIGPARSFDLLVSGRSITGTEAAAMGIAHEAAADPEHAALAYFEEHLKPKSASSLRYAVKAARLDYVVRVKEKIARRRTALSRRADDDPRRCGRSRGFYRKGVAAMATSLNPSATADIVARANALFEDLSFASARKWKAAEPGRKVVGYMPIYVPREIIHAAGMLPLGIVGGGDQLEVIHGDAYYQSYICRIPRSTIELGVTGRLDFVDGMLFPSICDVIRNLSGMWKLMFPHVYSHYFDVPQNYRDDIGGNFYVNELAELRHDLGELRGKPITDDELRHSIAVYNENRKLMRELYAFRAERPWQAPAAEVYLMVRAGLLLPVEEHTIFLRDYLAAARADERPMRDNCRVVLTGMFCEQPPLNLIKSLELSGCYVVDDDLLLVTRWLTGDVAIDGDPLRNLV